MIGGGDSTALGGGVVLVGGGVILAGVTSSVEKGNRTNSPQF